VIDDRDRRLRVDAVSVEQAVHRVRHRVGTEVDTGRHVAHLDELGNVVVLGVERLSPWSRERDVVRDAVQRELGTQRCRRRERRRDAGDDVRRDALAFERVDLFKGGPVHRGVAAVESDDGASALVGVPHQRDQLLEVLSH